MADIPKPNQRARAELARQVEQFLKQGGKVEHIPSHVMKRETGKKAGTLVTHQQQEA